MMTITTRTPTFRRCYKKANNRYHQIMVGIIVLTILLLANGTTRNVATAAPVVVEDQNDETTSSQVLRRRNPVQFRPSSSTATTTDPHNNNNNNGKNSTPSSLIDNIIVVPADGMNRRNDPNYRKRPFISAGQKSNDEDNDDAAIGDWWYQEQQVGRYRWGPIQCRLVLVDVSPENPDDDAQLDAKTDGDEGDLLTTYYCQMTDSHIDPYTVYQIQQPKNNTQGTGGIGRTNKDDVDGGSIVLSPSDVALIYKGRAWLSLSRAAVVRNSIIIHTKSDVTVSNMLLTDDDDGDADKDHNATINNEQRQRRRGLGMKIGVGRTLILRVIDATGRQPAQSALQLSDDFFGTLGTDSVNLASQMASCSGGQLQYQPAVDVVANRPIIVAGVMDVPISADVTLYGPFNAPSPNLRELESLIMQTASTILGYNPEATFDYVSIVTPPDTTLKFGTVTAKAYAYPNGKRSVYRSNRASEVSVQGHEFGHNNGLSHSGKGNETYGDRTCMMGSRASSDDGPRLCYNAAKSKQMGWYVAGELEVTGYWSGKVVCIDDYLNNPLYDGTQYRVLVYIGDRYLMFNRAQGPTVDIEPADQNKVTVVQQKTPLNYRDMSYVQATLDGGQSHSGKLPGGGNFVIKVMGVNVGANPAYADVIVYNSDLYSETGLAYPTPAPTAPPTPSPSAMPSAVLSSAPSVRLTDAPTFAPTLAPTTSSPSFTPTITESSSPSAAPVTASPTLSPTSPPTTSRPTAFPTKSPTENPTSVPSVMPSGAPVEVRLDVLPLAVSELDVLESAMILRRVSTEILSDGESDPEIEVRTDIWMEALTQTVSEMRTESTGKAGTTTNLYGVVLDPSSDVFTIQPFKMPMGASPDGIKLGILPMDVSDLAVLDSALTLRSAATLILTNSVGSDGTDIETSIQAWNKALKLTIKEMRHSGLIIDGGPLVPVITPDDEDKEVGRMTTNLYGVINKKQ